MLLGRAFQSDHAQEDGMLQRYAGLDARTGIMRVIAFRCSVRDLTTHNPP